MNLIAITFYSNNFLVYVIKNMPYLYCWLCWSQLCHWFNKGPGGSLS